ncbi:DUF2147 domain-containing protein [Treponema brennaborense]|uniref:DUF2147 domain-containing protein n=1 Tax=Treponema brennaborense (strain DSM 12168 / CIP 105900 / DD5/3) TaxID=906968 RepID=F4LLY4_TREBD|nr:DUF2147 domain-containing protein [Treponema brennaborense]AEE15676.1 Protein of unknown function DUF2147 [Treponema brennaborense DSM 12168]
MKRIAVLLATVMLCVCAVSAQDPVEGYWISVDEKTDQATAGWKIYVENGKLFGMITSVAGFPQDVKAFGCKGRGPYEGFPIPGELAEMTTVGTAWIYDLEKQAEGIWAKGSIVDPNDGKKYKCKITFRKADGKKYKTDMLEMRGEIGLGIGRSQFWTRATKEEAEALR